MAKSKPTPKFIQIVLVFIAILDSFSSLLNLARTLPRENPLPAFVIIDTAKRIEFKFIPRILQSATVAGKTLGSHADTERRGYPCHPSVVGHAEPSTTRIYPQVTIQNLNQVLPATHPAWLERKLSNDGNEEQAIRSLPLFHSPSLELNRYFV